MPTTASPVPPASASAPSRTSAVAPRYVEATIGPFVAGGPTCFANLFPCEILDFTLAQQGPIAVTLSWQGDARALFVQLYWEGRWLAHEDVAPAAGPSTISFRRLNMEANSYQLRIVTRQPDVAIPYRLELDY